ncbi:MAG: cbb3-type cytochrome c oxidase subunit 3, partial [Aestuariivirga sp.]
WNLLFMFAFFVGAIAWVMRPSAKQVHDDAASIPFKED